MVSKKKKLNAENAFANWSECGLCVSCYFIPGGVYLALAAVVIVGGAGG